MRAQHWLFLGIVLLAGYFIGAKWPAIAQRVGVAS
jgi:hypothetical protein